MKQYKVYFSDCTDIVWAAKNKKELMAYARLYIRQWQLDIKVERVEEVTRTNRA